MNLSEEQTVIEALASGSLPPDAALATIVGARGSTYRRPGARLLVGADGPLLGNLSGGCLEGEIAEAAVQVVRSGMGRVVTYDLSAEDEAVWGWGLGCNGVMDVLIEPAVHAQPLAAAVAAARRDRRRLAVATRLESGTPVMRAAGGAGELQISSGDPAQDEMVLRFGSGAPRSWEVVTTDEGIRYFFETFAPPPQVIVAGAGHDAVPVTEMCSYLGFHVVVTDEREHLLTRQRFPAAAEIVPADGLEGFLDRSNDARLLAVVMSHNYLNDLERLALFVGYPFDYIGVLGPRERLEKLLADLSERRVDVGASSLSVLHGPAGLDVGAEGPEEIAIAVAAELLAVQRGRSGEPLRDRPGPIHEDR